MAELLRRSRELGVTTFDLVEAPDLRFAAVALLTAFPRPDPELVALVPADDRSRSPVPGSESPTARATTGTFAAPRSSGDEPLALLSRFRRVLEARLDPRRPERFDSFVTRLLGARGEPGVSDVCVRCTSVEQVDLAMAHAGAPLVSADFSLLDQGLLGKRPKEAASGSARCIARNVFAGGRLDGSAWTTRVDPVRFSRGPPPSVRDLSADYSGVLQLGFLTERGSRTLAQAALAFVFAKPWVRTACLPLPPPDRLEEVLRFRAAPGLTASELAHAEQLGVAFGRGGPPGGS